MMYYFAFKGKARFINYINNYRTIKYFKENPDYDVFHPTYHSSYFSSFIKKKPCVITIHDMIMEERPEEIPGSKKYINQKKQIAKFATAIITPSIYSKEKILEHYSFIKPENVYVVNHAPPQKKKPIKLNIDINSDFILYVGSRLKYKNFHKLILAFASAIQNKKVKLLCIGGGKFTKDEKELITNNNLDGVIIQVNSNDEQLAWAYTNALAYICPSEEEGFGIPVLEAFNYSCPVLCSNKASLPEVAGNAAYYFDPNNIDEISYSLREVISNKTLQNKLVFLGKKQLSNFSSKKNCQQIVNVYRNVK